MLVWIMWVSWQVGDVKVFYRLQRKIGAGNQGGFVLFLGFFWSVLWLIPRIIPEQHRLAITDLA